jgi:hypothetical protein
MVYALNFLPPFIMFMKDHATNGGTIRSSRGLNICIRVSIDVKV